MREKIDYAYFGIFYLLSSGLYRRYRNFTCSALSSSRTLTAGMELHHSPKIFLCEKSDFDAEGAVEFSSAYDCTPEKANATKKHT